MLIRILKAWLRWRKDWDSLCNRCGKCCYTRSVKSDGEVIINYNTPCMHLDTETHLCKVFDDRFHKMQPLRQGRPAHSIVRAITPERLCLCADLSTVGQGRKIEIKGAKPA